MPDPDAPDEDDETWDVTEVSEYPGVVIEKRHPSKADRWGVEDKVVQQADTKTG